MSSLLDLLAQGHNQAALNNNNSSSAILKEIAALGERFERAVAAALLSLGGPVHGPTEDARHIIFRATDDEILERLDSGKKISGFGNSFYQEQIDPAFTAFYETLKEEESKIWEKLEHIASLIEEKKGKRLYPNAAAATAIVAEQMNLFPGTEIGLLIQCRLGAWAKLWEKARNGIKN